MMGTQKLTSTLSCQSQKLTDLNQQKSTVQPKRKAERDSQRGGGVVQAGGSDRSQAGVLKYKISA